MVVRIMGYSISKSKNLYIGLTSVYGIGQCTAKKICASLNLDPNCRVSEIGAQQINQINNHIRDNITVGDDLRKEIMENIRSLFEINCYRGFRLKKQLPSRGQRTRCNAKTARKMKYY